jgi:hypothetical protein
VDQGNDRHLGWRKKADGRPPGTTASAHIEIGIARQRHEASVMREKGLGYIVKRKDLAFMGMS